MGKTHRGKGIRNLPGRARGTCPVCKRTRVKLLYNRVLPDGSLVRVCKRCRTRHEVS
jgi:hypothetical protein